MKSRVARIGPGQLLFGHTARSRTVQPASPFLRNFFTSTPPTARLRSVNETIERSALSLFRCQRLALARRFRSLRLKSDRPNAQSHNPTPHLGSPEPAPSVSQRLKKLSREYGWTALAVYLGLSLLDFPFCFLAVRLLGTDRIGHYEHVLKDALWSVVRLAFPNAGRKSAEASADEGVAEATDRDGYVEAGRAAGHNGGADACMQNPSFYCEHLAMADKYCSNLDPTWSSLPCSQVSNLLPCATDCRRAAQGRKNPEELGV